MMEGGRWTVERAGVGRTQKKVAGRKEDGAEVHVWSGGHKRHQRQTSAPRDPDALPLAERGAAMPGASTASTANPGQHGCCPCPR